MKAKSLVRIIREKIDPWSIINIDELRAYSGLVECDMKNIIEPLTDQTSLHDERSISIQ